MVDTNVYNATEHDNKVWQRLMAKWRLPPGTHVPGAIISGDVSIKQLRKMTMAERIRLLYPIVIGAYGPRDNTNYHDQTKPPYLAGPGIR